MYTLPDLPYANDALEPYMSRQTVEYHYGKHEATYIDKLNSIISGSDFEDMCLEDIIASSDGVLFNNASQAFNHIFFFFTFSPNAPTEPSGELREAIDSHFGSFESFKQDFIDAGVNLFGSGWVWLACDESGKLMILPKENAGTPLTDGLIPLLAFDVWEHAYYLDYKNRRVDALNALWAIVDWDVVSSRYELD